MLDYIRIACAVSAVKVGDVKKNTEDICAWMAKADEKNADIVVFPELAMTGYTCGDLFYQETLHNSVEKGLLEILETSRSYPQLTAVIGLPVGVGDHPFDGMEGRISAILFSIPAVKAVAFGDGFDFVTGYGSTHNDAYRMNGGEIVTKSNHCGGIVGGMSTGMPVIFSCGFKPTPSIGCEQESVSLTRREDTVMTVKGRHDPCIVPRAVPVVEAAAAVAVVDMMLDE